MKLNWSNQVGRKVKKSFNLPGSCPRVKDDCILFGSTTATFKSVNKNTGKLEWEYFTDTVNAKGILSTAAIKDTSIWFGAYNGCLYELDLDTGLEKGKYKLCDWIGSSPIIVDNLLVIGLEYRRTTGGTGQGGSIAGFNLETRQLDWEIPNKSSTHGSASYSRHLDTFVCGTNDSVVYAFNYDGEIINTLICAGPVKYAPLMIGDCAVFGSHNGSFIVWDYNKNKFINTDGRGNSPIYTTPVFVNDKIYANNMNGTLFCYVNGGINTYELGENIYGPLTQHENNLLIPTRNGNIIVFDTSSNEIIHRWNISETSINRRPFVENGDVYVIDDNDTVFSIRI